MTGRRSHQQLYREIERVERDFVQLDDDWGALEKALWQVRYNVTIYGRTEPHPDFRAVDDWLLLEAMLVAALEENHSRVG